MSGGSRAIPLGLKVTLTFSAIILVSLGSGLVFATHWMASLYGTTESTAGNNAVQMAGAAIFALGILAWLGKGYEPRVVRNIVLPVMFIWFLLKSVVAYTAFIAGIFKAPVGLTILLCDVTLTAVYAGFLFKSWREIRQ